MTEDPGLTKEELEAIGLTEAEFVTLRETAWAAEQTEHALRGLPIPNPVPRVWYEEMATAAVPHLVQKIKELEKENRALQKELRQARKTKVADNRSPAQ